MKLSKSEVKFDVAGEQLWRVEVEKTEWIPYNASTASALHNRHPPSVMVARLSRRDVSHARLALVVVPG